MGANKILMSQFSDELQMLLDYVRGEIYWLWKEKEKALEIIDFFKININIW